MRESAVAGLHYRELGDGPALLLLHAGTGLDGSTFFPWFERLADRHRVIAVDLPGNGRSEDGEPGGWTLSGSAAAVRRFADELGLDDYTLLGHSFGGFVALTHAVEHPGHAARVVASCTAASEAAVEGGEERMARVEPAEVRERIVAAFEREGSVQTPEDCRAMWADQMPFFLADPTGPLVGEIAARWSDVVYRPEVTRHEDWGDLDLRAALPGVAVPVLAIGGWHDRATPPGATIEIAGLARHGTAVVLPDAGHFPYAEVPGLYFGTLGGWLEAHRDSR